MTEVDQNHCPRHPDQSVVARCVRFNRRFCELCFQDPDDKPECLSEGTYCEYRSQCTLYERVKRRRREERRKAAESASTSAEAGGA